MFLIKDNPEALSLVAQGLNPLNQVYVFNATGGNMPCVDGFPSLNPLNQVYVFNATAYNIFYCKELQARFRKGCFLLLQIRAFLLQKM